MDFRYLGNSGMQISEITYGNWLTHGSQVENDVATQCVRAALDAGITSFDTADVYANGRAEQVLGAALHGERRESLEVFTKVYWPVGPDPRARTTWACRASTFSRESTDRCAAWAWITSTSTRPTATTRSRRSRRRCRRSPTWCARARRSTSA